MSERIKTTLNKSMKSKYRFVILNDATFEEMFSLILSKTNLWIFLSTVVVILVIITSSAIIYTPLKYFIPGFGDYNYKNQIIELTLQTDSLEKALNAKSLKDRNFIKIITDSGLVDETDQLIENSIIVPDQNAKIRGSSKEEMELRKEMSEVESFSINYKKEGKIDAASLLNEYYFMSPVKGVITDEFNAADKHYGIDIVANKNEPVKATLDGSVISSGFEVETGYTITIQHKDNIVSVYKHNAKIFKSLGETVKAGDVIAAVGNTGTLSSGPHLHFEIWHLGKALNPRDFIVF